MLHQFQHYLPVNAELANLCASEFPDLTSLALEIEASDEPVSLTFAGMPNVRSIRVKLTQDIQQLTLENLPLLGDFHIESIDSNGYNFEESQRSPGIAEITMKNLPSDLRSLWIPVPKQFLCEPKIRVNFLGLSLPRGNQISTIESAFTRVGSLSIKAEDEMDAKGLGLLIGHGNETRSYTKISLDVPVYRREYSDAIDDHTTHLQLFSIRTDRFADERPFAFDSVSDTHSIEIKDATIEKLSIGKLDLPDGLFEIALDNVTIDEWHFDGYQCTLRVESAIEFDEMHIRNVIEPQRHLHVFATPHENRSRSKYRFSPQELHLSNMDVLICSLREGQGLERVYLQDIRGIRNSVIDRPRGAEFFVSKTPK